jgi:hypothetical protein
VVVEVADVRAGVVVMKIGGSERLIRAAVSANQTEWSNTPWPSSASMFCSTAGRGPMRNIRLSPK